ncbi:MAG: L-threonine 3-dehydrogenase [Coriobacteriia bacterium]|nr:L-threonine 3-dehydrogenase [Coriobacteriia bacterium]MBN2822824.1 L-threonine 3-dehydrogenase [Coriobacteriia bacterium]
MKALSKTSPAPGATLVEVPVPKIGAGDLLIRIEKVAICGTDVHIYDWNPWAQRTINPPQIYGHEFVGHVAEMGGAVSGFSVGQRVSGEGHIVCGVCRSCRAGRRHLCTNTVGVGVNRDGCFAEYLALPAKNAWHLADSIPSRIATIFDPFGNATHAALSFDLVGEDVLITGAGPIGIMAVAIAKHVGARNVVITDVNDYRLDLAMRMGATRAVNVSRNTIADAMEELGMIGFDVGLEMSGNGTAFETMLESMHNGGRIALLGIAPGPVSIDWDEVVFRGLTIKGIYGREIWETWYKMQTMLQSGLDIAPVITHELPFMEYEAGFAAMIEGRSGKVVLDMGGL